MIFGLIKNNNMINNYIFLIQKKSSIGCTKKQKSTLKCLGLRKVRDSVLVMNNNSIIGMINIIKFMVEIKYVKIK